MIKGLYHEADLGGGGGNGGGDNLPAYHSQLSGDLQGHEALSNLSTISDVAKAYIDLKGNTEGAVKIPGEDAKPEEVQAFWSKLGTPENHDGYQFDKPDIPEGMPYNDNFGPEFAKLAHSLKMPPQMANGVFKWVHELAVKGHQEKADIEKELETAIEKGTNELKGEWKDSFDANKAKAEKVLTEFGGEDFKQLIEDAGLIGHPTMLRIFHKVADLISEDGEFTGTGGASDKRPTDATGRPRISFPSMDK